MFIDLALPRISNPFNLICAIALTTCFASAPGFAQQSEIPDDDEEFFEESYEPVEPYVREEEGENRFNPSGRSSSPIVNSILGDVQRCERFPWVYRYDCLQWVFKDASDVKTQGSTNMSEAKQILASASAKLDAVVRANLDPAQPPSRIGSRQIRAVKQSSRAEVDAATRAIVQETETLLLRSGDTQQKQAEYTKIAEAVSSTEILLRSALETLHRFALILRPLGTLSS